MVMDTYTNESMVKQKHINEIERQLIKLGSALPQNFDKTKDRALSNILRLATGDGTNKVSLELINKISSEKFEFKIKWE
ncbi:MAG: hypothetical protein ACI83B_003792 [Sediminicola sp.]|jgi:hypothetical protein